MRVNSKLLVAGALAVIAVVFGLGDTVVPGAKLASSQQSLSSPDLTLHFQNPPTFDSDWNNVTDKCGQYFNITHGLNSMNVTVNITGKTTLDGGPHQRHLGLSGYTPGWSRTYGGPSYDVAYSLIQTDDGGYALAGVSGGDFWLVKTDWTGTMEWNQTYGGADIDVAYSLVQTYGGGYALAGYTSSFGAGGSDCYLVKTHANGTMRWSQTYGGSGNDVAYSLVQTYGGGYALAGYTSSFGIPYHDFWLVKTDGSGNVQWNKTYGPGEAHSLVQTSDGGFALAGDGFADLVKTDANGDVVWNRTYGGFRTARSVVQTNDGYALAGNLYGDQFWLAKTDQDGNMTWERAWWVVSPDEYSSVECLVQTNDGGYALVGWVAPTTHYIMMAGLVKTDSAGNMQWAKTMGWTYDYRGYSGFSVVQTLDHGLAIAGYIRYPPGSADIPDDFWLTRIQVESGLAWMDSTDNTLTLYRGETDPYWNYVRVRIWTIEEPTWQFGDVNQDGVVDCRDLAIVSQNYGKTFSLLGLSGIVFIAGVHTHKKRKLPKETS